MGAVAALARRQGRQGRRQRGGLSLVRPWQTLVLPGRQRTSRRRRAKLALENGACAALDRATRNRASRSFTLPAAPASARIDPRRRSLRAVRREGTRGGRLVVVGLFGGTFQALADVRFHRLPDHGLCDRQPGRTKEMTDLVTGGKATPVPVIKRESTRPTPHWRSCARSDHGARRPGAASQASRAPRPRLRDRSACPATGVLLRAEPAPSRTPTPNSRFGPNTFPEEGRLVGRFPGSSAAPISLASGCDQAEGRDVRQDREHQRRPLRRLRRGARGARRRRYRVASAWQRNATPPGRARREALPAFVLPGGAPCAEAKLLSAGGGAGRGGATATAHPRGATGTEALEPGARGRAASRSSAGSMITPATRSASPRSPHHRCDRPGDVPQSLWRPRHRGGHSRPGAGQGSTNRSTRLSEDASLLLMELLSTRPLASGRLPCAPASSADVRLSGGLVSLLRALILRLRLGENLSSGLRETLPPNRPDLLQWIGRDFVGHGQDRVATRRYQASDAAIPRRRVQALRVVQGAGRGAGTPPSSIRPGDRAPRRVSDQAPLVIPIPRRCRRLGNRSRPCALRSMIPADRTRTGRQRPTARRMLYVVLVCGT